MNSDIKSKVWPQCLAAVSASIGMICAGTVVGWASPSYVILLSDESPIKMTYEQIGWMTALISIIGPVPPITCTYFVDRFGRRPVLLLAGVLYIINWLVGALARDVPMLFFSKIIATLATGITFRFTLLYTAEVTDVTKRGAFGVLNLVSALLGALFQSIVGPRVSFSTLQYISMIFPVLFLLCFSWMPETPYFLVSRNRIDEAYDSLMWLRGHTDRSAVEDEMYKVKLYSQKTEAQSFTRTVRKLISRRNRQAILLMLILSFGQNFSGFLSFSVYTELIFIQIDSPINSSDAVIILGVFGLFFVFVSIFMMDKMGRKILVLISLLGTSLSNALIGTYLILSKSDILGTESAWIAMVGLFGYKAFFNIGLASIPMILLSEIFESDLKTWSMCVLSVYESFLGFTVSKLFQVVDESIGSYLNYYIYSFSCLFTCIFVAFFMPETKNKSFDEIQDLLNGKEERDSNKHVEKYVKNTEDN